MILITNLSRSSFKFNVNIAKYLFLHKTWQTKYTNIIHYFIKEILCLYMNSDKYGTEFITLKYYCYSWESACKIVTSVLYLLVLHLCVVLSHQCWSVTPTAHGRRDSMSQQDYLIKDYIQLASWTSFATHYLSLSLGLLVLREASCYDMRIFRDLYRNAQGTEVSGKQPVRSWSLPTTTCVSLEVNSPALVKPWDEYSPSQQLKWNLYTLYMSQNHLTKLLPHSCPSRTIKDNKHLLI